MVNQSVSRADQESRFRVVFSVARVIVLHGTADEDLSRLQSLVLCFEPLVRQLVRGNLTLDRGIDAHNQRAWRSSVASILGIAVLWRSINSSVFAQNRAMALQYCFDAVETRLTMAVGFHPIPLCLSTRFQKFARLCLCRMMSWNRTDGQPGFVNAAPLRRIRMSAMRVNRQIDQLIASRPPSG